MDVDSNRGTNKPCDLKNDTINTCVEDIMIQINQDLRHCNCNPSCEEEHFEALLSVSTWPSKQYEVRSSGHRGRRSEK